jgi:hypothetical protein
LHKKPHHDSEEKPDTGDAAAAVGLMEMVECLLVDVLVSEVERVVWC